MKASKASPITMPMVSVRTDLSWIMTKNSGMYSAVPTARMRDEAAGLMRSVRAPAAGDQDQLEGGADQDGG